MRDYSRIAPEFWTGDTGRKIRELGPELRVIATYLLSAPAANMIGLYYIPVPTISHETGIPTEAALKALRRLSEAAFAHYCQEHEVVVDSGDGTVPNR